MYRLISVTIVVFWITAMSALFMRDVYPAWTAQDVPPVLSDPDDRSTISEQLGIFDAEGQRRGTAWSEVSHSSGMSSMEGVIFLNDLGSLKSVLIVTDTEFVNGELDNFELRVLGVPGVKIRVHGERHGIYFPCELQAGPFFREVNLESTATRMVGDVFRPFSYLPALKVGQSWRMQMIDPISAVLGGKARLTSLVAKVVRQETRTFGDQTIECFVVTTSPGQVTAWIGPDGKVYEQQMNVPMLGPMTVRYEPMDEQARLRTEAMFSRENRREKQGQP